MQISSFHELVLVIQQILEFQDLKGHTHFWPPPPPKIVKVTFSFLNLYQHTKNQFILFISPWHTTNFRVLGKECPHPTPIFFNQLVIFMNLYQHAKNQAFSSSCSRDVVDLKILQSDWPRAFWPIAQEPDFSQNRICARIQQII